MIRAHPGSSDLQRTEATARPEPQATRSARNSERNIAAGAQPQGARNIPLHTPGATHGIFEEAGQQSRQGPSGTSDPGSGAERQAALSPHGADHAGLSPSAKQPDRPNAPGSEEAAPAPDPIASEPARENPFETAARDLDGHRPDPPARPAQSGPDTSEPDLAQQMFRSQLEHEKAMLQQFVEGLKGASSHYNQL